MTSALASINSFAPGLTRQTLAVVVTNHDLIVIQPWLNLGLTLAQLWLNHASTLAQPALHASALRGPQGVPSPDNIATVKGFTYQRLGVRIPTIAISPWYGRAVREPS